MNLSRSYAALTRVRVPFAFPSRIPSHFGCSGRQASLPFGDNPFEIMLAGKPEQPFAITLDVIAIKEPFPALRDNGA